MRDILVTLIVFGTIPFIFSRPYVGIYVASWLGYMNPHRLTWGFAYTMPFSAIITICLITAMFFSKEKNKLPINRITVFWMFFISLTVITSIFALNPDGATEELTRFVKIQIVIFCTLLLINNRQKLNYLVWTIALSIGFFGIKGGVFSILTGLQHRVLGPPGSFIAENNTMSLAILMVIPLFYFLYKTAGIKYIKMGLIAAIVLCVISVIASYSRGAFITILVLAFFLWISSKNKLIIMLFIFLFSISIAPFIPDKWYDRMDTIKTYEQDESANLRLNSWGFAINLANDRPIFGGGFRTFTKDAFALYSPDPDFNKAYDAHSIYFEVLAEHGYLGFFLYSFMWVFVFIQIYRLKKRAKESKDSWLYNLMWMVQLSLIAYMTGGAFLGLAYFDLPYHLMSIVVIAGSLVNKVNAEGSQERAK